MSNFDGFPPQAIVALITAGATLAGVFLGFFLSVLRDKWQEKASRRRLASALLAEIEALSARYNEVFGKTIRAVPPGQPLTGLGAVIISQDFFTVFDRNADKLGFFHRADVHTIVKAYTMAKGYAESLRQVASHIDGREQKIALLASQRHPAASQLGDELNRFLIQSADLLRREDAALQALMEEARAVLTKYADC